MARLMTVQGWVPEHLLLRHPLHTAAAMALQEWIVREGGGGSRGREGARKKPVWLQPTQNVS